jgi:hypothetical protein
MNRDPASADGKMKLHRVISVLESASEYPPPFAVVEYEMLPG